MEEDSAKNLDVGRDWLTRSEIYERMAREERNLLDAGELVCGTENDVPGQNVLLADGGAALMPWSGSSSAEDRKT